MIASTLNLIVAMSHFYYICNIEISVPDNWEYDKKDIVNGYHNLVEVEDQQEIKKIKKILRSSGLTLDKAIRIQNWNLYRKYQIRKAEVTEAVKKYKPNAQVERYLFHGTQSSKLDAICRSGFDRDFSGTAGGSLQSL